MAELVLSSVMNSIIKRLHSEAVQQIGVKDEHSGPEYTISCTKALLPDAEEKQVHNHQVGDWLMWLEDAVYEADGLVDELSYKALRQQAGMLGSDNIAAKARW